MSLAELSFGSDNPRLFISLEYLVLGRYEGQLLFWGMIMISTSRVSNATKQPLLRSDASSLKNLSFICSDPSSSSAIESCRRLGLTHMHTHTHTHTHTRTHAHAHTHTHTQAHTQAHTRTHAHAHTHTHTHTHTHKHTHKHTRAHTRTHTHTHGYVRAGTVVSQADYNKTKEKLLCFPSCETQNHIDFEPVYVHSFMITVTLYPIV